MMKTTLMCALFATLVWGQAEKKKPETKTAAQTKEAPAAPRQPKQFVPPAINWKYASMPYTRGVTYENYDWLREGMSYTDAVEALGARGEETASSSLGDHQTVIYSWKAKEGIGNMNVTFLDGKLVAKAQFGLK